MFVQDYKEKCGEFSEIESEVYLIAPSADLKSNKKQCQIFFKKK